MTLTSLSFVIAVLVFMLAVVIIRKVYYKKANAALDFVQQVAVSVGGFGVFLSLHLHDFLSFCKLIVIIMWDKFQNQILEKKEGKREIIRCGDVQGRVMMFLESGYHGH